MIARHSFKNLIEVVQIQETGIDNLERSLNCYMDNNWMTQVPNKLIRTIAESFFSEVVPNSKEDLMSNTIEGLLYHFIYMEDCGNDSEHCKTKLVTVNEGKEDQHSVSCTNLDELYNVITSYIEHTDCDFTFNFCHSYHLDEELKDEN